MKVRQYKTQRGAEKRLAWCQDMAARRARVKGSTYEEPEFRARETYARDFRSVWIVEARTGPFQPWIGCA